MEAPTPVQVETVRKGPIDHVVTADAVLYPVNQANVTAKISSPVKRVLVNRGRSCEGRAVADRTGDAPIWRRPRMKARVSTIRRQAALQTVTGATVVEDKSKGAEPTCNPRSRSSKREESLRQPCGAAETGCAGAAAGGRSESLAGAGAKRLRHREKTSRHAEFRGPAGTNPSAQAQVDAAKAHLRELRQCSFPTEKLPAPYREWFRTGPLIRAKCRRVARR